MGILNKIISPFTSAKTGIINAVLDDMPNSTKQIVLKRVVAKQLPAMHIKYRPNMHPKSNQSQQMEFAP